MREECLVDLGNSASGVEMAGCGVRRHRGMGLSQMPLPEEVQSGVSGSGYVHLLGGRVVVHRIGARQGGSLWYKPLWAGTFLCGSGRRGPNGHTLGEEV